MTSANKRFAQKAIAVVVIVTLLYGAGVAPVVMMFVTAVVLVIFVVSRRAQNKEVERIFDFYLAAEAILRDEDRRWYGFEVAEVIEHGEMALEELPDPPPLLMFTLGALHHLIGNDATSKEYLSRVVEDEGFEERNRTAPSGQLRRYVSLLRRIEGEPSLAPQTLGAVRSLERMRRRRAFTLLVEARKSLTIVDPPKINQTATAAAAAASQNATVKSEIRPPVSPPPPIRDVLHDIYQDEHPPN
jgi:hypothetical protein